MSSQKLNHFALGVLGAAAYGVFMIPFILCPPAKAFEILLKLFSF